MRSEVACFACACLDVPHIQLLFAAATRIDEEMLLLVLRGNDKGLGLAGQDSASSVILDDMERHPGPTIAALMKLSFDEEHRHAMCQLGGLHAVAELIQVCNCCCAVTEDVLMCCLMSVITDSSGSTRSVRCNRRMMINMGKLSTFSENPTPLSIYADHNKYMFMCSGPPELSFVCRLTYVLCNVSEFHSDF